MKTLRATFALAVGLTLAVPVQATTIFEQTFTCPVGGEGFTASVVGSTSSWGQRADGKPIGGVAPWPVVECPTNGLPLFEESFEPEEIVQLTRLIATPEFAALRERDTTYRRIWWLRRELGADPFTLASDLLAASWETDDDAMRKARYQADFAAAVDALERDPAVSEAWFWLSLRGANAYRELGRFADADRLLRAIDRPDFLPQDEDQRDGARSTIFALQTLVSERNTAAEPVNVIGPQEAVFRCRERPDDMTTSEIAACDSPEYREAMAEYEGYLGDAAEDQFSEEAAAADAEANAEAAGVAADEAAQGAAEAVEAASADDRSQG